MLCTQPIFPHTSRAGSQLPLLHAPSASSAPDFMSRCISNANAQHLPQPASASLKIRAPTYPSPKCEMCKYFPHCPSQRDKCSLNDPFGSHAAEIKAYLSQAGAISLLRTASAPLWGSWIRMHQAKAPTAGNQQGKSIKNEGVHFQVQYK